VAQKGSLVAPERLRFDFSHPKPVTDEEVIAVEEMANAIILQDSPVETRLMDRDGRSPWVQWRCSGKIRRRGPRRVDGHRS
jgi:alanyl-tRNA synthetase